MDDEHRFSSEIELDVDEFGGRAADLLSIGGGGDVDGGDVDSDDSVAPSQHGSSAEEEDELEDTGAHQQMDVHMQQPMAPAGAAAMDGVVGQEGQRLDAGADAAESVLERETPAWLEPVAQFSLPMPVSDLDGLPAGSTRLAVAQRQREALLYLQSVGGQLPAFRGGSLDSDDHELMLKATDDRMMAGETAFMEQMKKVGLRLEWCTCLRSHPIQILKPLLKPPGRWCRSSKSSRT